MKKIMNWLETGFAPKMNKFANNPWISSIKDTVNQIMPLIFLGSFFCVLTLPSAIKGLEWFSNFWTPFGWTMSVVSIMMAFLLPMNLMDKFRLRKNRNCAAIAGLILYGMTITPQLVADGAIGFSHDAFGTSGMFISMITGCIVGLVFKVIGKMSFFKEDSALPDFVRQWFDQMLPIGIIVLGGWLIIDILHFDLYIAIQTIFKPLGDVYSTIWGFTLGNLLVMLLYSMGISGWILAPIQTPILLANIESNITQGTNFFATSSWDYAYLKIGGLACTLSLVLFMVFLAKSNKLKALGRATIVPSIFNINEPIVFGAIVFNPLLMVPMWINAIVAPVLAWLLTVVIPFGKIPDILYQLWYIPYPITTWLATGGSFSSVVVMLIVFVVTGLIWYPFFKAYEKQCIEEEANNG